jgi:rSAM/selenodomain-associated transferase 2
VQSVTAKISVIIPTLNEEGSLSRVLPALQTFRQRGHEIILVDGGSYDRTLSIARPYVDRLMQTVKGRAHQMNQGADVAKNSILLFLHADTQLPPMADRLIMSALQSETQHWGRFDIRLNNEKLIYRIIENSVNWRSALSGIVTGDQAIFVKKRSFEDVGYFDRIPLMEDVSLSKKLKKMSPPLRLKERVLTSSRRWEKQGIIRTILLMWLLRAAYALGVRPEKLADKYYPDSC